MLAKGEHGENRDHDGRESQDESDRGCWKVSEADELCPLGNRVLQEAEEGQQCPVASGEMSDLPPEGFPQREQQQRQESDGSS